MMIALAESLIEHGRVEQDQLARAFRAAYEPERGYGGGTRRVLELWAAGTPVAIAAGRLFGGEGSRGNGAAMRIAPVAVRFRDNPRRLCAEAAASARVTHAHPVGIDGAVVQAAAIGAALRDQDSLQVACAAARTPEVRAALQAVGELLTGPPDPDAVRARLGASSGALLGAPSGAGLGASSDAAESVCAAIYSALAHPTFESAVRFAVRLGGDTDTVAAMTGAISGASHGAGAIPRRWLDALEEGARGRGHVERLAARLARTGGA
jgi:poly(ADP-ribose) glycohydrolase ARH3